MRYLSFDIEATGLNEDCLMIEFACVPFCLEKNEIQDSLKFHHYIQCPSFETLKPKLDQWVIEHNEELIQKAHNEGIELKIFKDKFQQYLESEAVKKYFSNEKIVLFGKSMNAIDLPFLNRDLGWDWMRKYFSHRILDLSCVSYAYMDLGLFPKGMESGTKLMNYFNMGEVAHTALEDAYNTAKMYIQMVKKFQKEN